MQRYDLTLKKHYTPDGRLLLAICDSELLGKRFSEGNLQLDLRPGFYQGKQMAEADALRLMHAASIVHVVGKRSVAALKKAGYTVAPLSIDGVPHAQLVLL
ncbi:MAG: DUF424 family protein [Nanoarchaeota archaeon]